jgi:NADH-quinone oxidoreductase subunit J
MVYAGAIMVLFLFVVMMLKLSGSDKAPEKTDKRLFVAVPLAVALTAVVLTKFVQPLFIVPVTQVSDDYGRPSEIGPALFTTYVWPFEIASVLLLIGVVGSIMLAKRKF